MRNLSFVLSVLLLMSCSTYSVTVLHNKGTSTDINDRNAKMKQLNHKPDLMIRTQPSESCPHNLH